MIHCRIYQSVKSQWKWEDLSVLLLLPWKVLSLIDLYNYLYLLINLPGTMYLAFLLIIFFSRSILQWYLPRFKTFYLSLDIYSIKARVKYKSKFFISMYNKEKIEVAEQRILELKTLINHWKTSNISSRRATVDFVESILTEKQETQAVWFTILCVHQNI